MRAGIVGLILLALVGATFIPPVHVADFFWRYARWGSVADYLNPTAERAYEIGSYHLSSHAAGAYDIRRAEQYFWKAVRRDPEHDLVWHQLARTAFLLGDTTQALERINLQIALGGEATPPATYYIKGLILGYMGRYAEAAESYARYLRTDPTNWAAVTDYSWVLIQNKQPDLALKTIEEVLEQHVNNPWLLNTAAIAAYEAGNGYAAEMYAEAAYQSLGAVTEAEWLRAYPGNDPRVASLGVETFKNAVIHNRERLREGSDL